MRKSILTAVTVAVFAVMAMTPAFAGSLDAPAPPTSAGSAMYTIESIYQRLLNGASGTKRPGPFVEPTSAPGSTGHTLDEVMALAPALDAANGATAGNVLTGKKFWGLTGAGWGLQTGTLACAATATGNAADTDVLAGKTFSNASANGITGTMPAQTVSSTATSQPAGYYAAFDLATVDTDLAAANIVSGKTVFGVAGTYPLAAVPKSGQTTSYLAGDDGSLQKGVAFPSPRFTDNSNGTVTDNLTGLIWLKDANCATVSPKVWADALTSCNSLASGVCGLTDGSTVGQWRLPNLRELQSLIDYQKSNPALSTGHPFINVQSIHYWAATVFSGNIWRVNLASGEVGNDPAAFTRFVWPVR